MRETPGVYTTAADLEPNEVQDLGEAIPDLLGITAGSDIPLRFRVSVESGSKDKPADDETIKQLNVELKKIKGTLDLK